MIITYKRIFLRKKEWWISLATESSLTKWLATARTFSNSAGIDIKDYWTFNFANIKSTAYRIGEERGLTGASLEGFVRNVNNGLPRYFGQYLIDNGVPNITHKDLLREDKDYIAFLEQFKIETPPELVYVENITMRYPTPFNGEKIESISALKGEFSPYAYCGHYITVGLEIPAFLDLLESNIAPNFDFQNLHYLLNSFFNANAMFETFKSFSQYRVAFRICFVGAEQKWDKDTEETYYEGTEFFSFVHFDDSNASLIRLLTEINQRRKEKEFYSNEFGGDVEIKWILPLFPFEDSEQFQREFGTRTGFYCFFSNQHDINRRNKD